MKTNKVMVLILALFLISSMVFAQGASVTTVTVNTSATALALTTSNGGIDGVIRGVTYTVVFDAYAGGSSVLPNTSGEAPNGDVGVDIFGDVSASVVVDMNLPDHLLGTGGTMLPIMFPSSGPGGGVRVETGEFFNPHVSNNFNLGLGGVCNLRLGYIFTVPVTSNIAGDAYIGQILTTASYTGL